MEKLEKCGLKRARRDYNVTLAKNKLWAHAKDCWAAAAADGRKVPRFPAKRVFGSQSGCGQRAETEARFVLLWLRFNGRCRTET